MKINWGTGLVIFFTLFIISMVGFVFYSLNQNRDLESEDYYEEGADYTHHMEIDQRSVVFKDSIKIQNVNENIEIKVAESLGKKAKNFQAFFFRPSNKKLDYTVSLNPNEKILLVEKKKLTHGRYLVKFSWTIDQIKYLVIKDFDVKQ